MKVSVFKAETVVMKYVLVSICLFEIFQASFGLTQSQTHIKDAGRPKRALTNVLLSAVTFTQEMKDSIVDSHNHYRRQSNSSDMRLMSWDDDLAAFALTHVRNCEYAHSTNPTLEPFGILGENLLLHITDADDFSNQPILGATTTWHNEIGSYDYELQLCLASCGHYIQVVYAQSHKIGCGAVFCADTNLDFHHLLLSCNYAPANNIVSQPFEKGLPCSSCATPTDICVEDLCANANRGDFVNASQTSAPPSATTIPSMSSSTQATSTNRRSSTATSSSSQAPTEPTISQTTTDGKPCLSSSGQPISAQPFEKPGDCRNYYQCVSGELLTLQCTTGKSFNSATGSCDFSYNVPGCDGSATSISVANSSFTTTSATSTQNPTNSDQQSTTTAETTASHTQASTTSSHLPTGPSQHVSSASSTSSAYSSDSTDPVTSSSARSTTYGQPTPTPQTTSGTEICSQIWREEMRDYREHLQQWKDQFEHWKRYCQ